MVAYVILRICGLQKSKLLAITERATPSWERRIVTVVPQVEKEGETPGGPSTTVSTSVGTSRDLQSTAELWHWIQEALGDAQTRTRLLEGEDLLDLLRNGLPPGIRNAVRANPAVTLDPAAAPPANTESEEVECSSEITEAEVISEAGTSDSPGLLSQVLGLLSCQSLLYLTLILFYLHESLVRMFIDGDKYVLRSCKT